MMLELVAEEIEKQLGTVPVLRGISFQLQQGEILALLGPSGSGKTTLLRTVVGLERPDAGKIELRGLDKTGQYKVVDYEHGKDLGTVDGANPTLSTRFKTHLLLEVSKL